MSVWPRSIGGAERFRPLGPKAVGTLIDWLFALHGVYLRDRRWSIGIVDWSSGAPRSLPASSKEVVKSKKIIAAIAVATAHAPERTMVASREVA
jgi:hypothetical protein